MAILVHVSVDVVEVIVAIGIVVICVYVSNSCLAVLIELYHETVDLSMARMAATVANFVHLEACGAIAISNCPLFGFTVLRSVALTPTIPTS